MHLLALSCTGHYVPLLSLAVAQYSRANADSGFNLQGLAAGDCTFLATLTRKPPLKRIAGLRIASFPSKPSHTKPVGRHRTQLVCGNLMHRRRDVCIAASLCGCKSDPKLHLLL